MPATGDRITGRKDGLFQAMYTAQTADGPKRRYVYGREFKALEKELAEAMGDAARGFIYDAGTITVGEYLRGWLANSVRDTVRQRTYERYESIIRVHLIPSIGRVKLRALTPAHVRGLYRSKMDSGLAPRSVLHIHRTLSKALKQAVMDGPIPRNAATPVKPPRPRKEEIRPLGREQVRSLFEAARGDRLEALYVLAVTAGLRRGELQALTWVDVDLEAGTLQVRRTLSEPKGGYIFEAPKRAARAARYGLHRGPQKPPQASARGEAKGRRALAGSRSRLALRHRHSPVGRQPEPHIQGATQARRTARDTLPRSAAHVRHAPTEAGRKPKVRAGASRARRYKPYPQRLQPCTPRHGRCRSAGRRARLKPLLPLILAHRDVLGVWDFPGTTLPNRSRSAGGRRAVARHPARLSGWRNPALPPRSADLPPA